MKTHKINATIITLLSAIAFLSGCGDEQKEASKQTETSKPTEQAISEPAPEKPVSEAVKESTETTGKTVETVESPAEQAVEKTTEAAQDLVSKTETATTNVVEPVKEEVSDASEVVKTTPEQVRKIQQALMDAGFNPGPVDGVIGPKTKAALESFQKQKNLAVGQITKGTLRALGIEK